MKNEKTTFRSLQTVWDGHRSRVDAISGTRGAPSSLAAVRHRRRANARMALSAAAMLLFMLVFQTEVQASPNMLTTRNMSFSHTTAQLDTITSSLS